MTKYYFYLNVVQQWQNNICIGLLTSCRQPTQIYTDGEFQVSVRMIQFYTYLFCLGKKWL
jgi:hypothetical protein